MKFFMNGVGVLPDIEIELDGFTVISGLNGSGKSTILKAIYSILDSSSEFDKKKLFEIEETVLNLVWKYDEDEDLFTPNKTGFSITDTIEILTNSDKLTNNEKEIIDYVKKLADGNLDDEFHKTILGRIIKSEFGKLSQFKFNGSDSNSTVELTYLGKKRTLTVSYNDLSWDGEYKDLPSVVYYDTPFIIDDSIRSRLSHRKSIGSKLYNKENSGIVNEIIADKRLEEYDRCIEKILPGKIQFIERSFNYIQPDKKMIDVKNLAAGMKVFAIIRKLIENGAITSDSVVLLDEPEVHLHPQWQLILGESLVILSKSVGCKILMTTHSPLLLRSIQLYSKMHEQSVHYYCIDVKSDDVNNQSKLFHDLGSNPEFAYSSMADAFDRVEDLFQRYE